MEKISTFAERLKTYREENKLTLKDLEQKTGVPAQTLNRYELGQRIPKVNKANEIAKRLGVNALWLQGFDVPQEPDEELDEDIRMISRAAQKMTPGERKEMMEVLKIAFKKAFNNEKQ